MQNAQKFVVKTDSNKVYSLHVINAIEYNPVKFVGLFLFYDDDNNFQNVKHRLLFENSVKAILDKVIEYLNGRGENAMIEENGLILV